MLRLLLTLLAVGGGLRAQSVFRPAYLIDGAGERREVLIRDRDWVDSPRSLQYRTAPGAAVQEAALNDITAFGFADGGRRFERHTVALDRSATDPRFLSRSPRPEYTLEEVLLEVLVDGQADLLYYERGALRRYFYRQADLDPQPLVSRRYLAEGGSIRRDDTFRGELSREVWAAEAGLRPQLLDYQRRALIRYFLTYNEAVERPAVAYGLTPAVRRWRLSAIAGAGWGQLRASEFGLLSEEGAVRLPKAASPRYAVEVAFRLPFARDRWELTAEVGQQRYRSVLDRGDSTTVAARYTAVSVPLGFRYLLPLGGPGKHRLALATALSLQFPTRSALTFIDGGTARVIDLRWNHGLEFGLSYQLRDRYRLELRYGHRRSLTDWYVDYPTAYQSYGLLFAYRLVTF